MSFNECGLSREIQRRNTGSDIRHTELAKVSSALNREIGSQKGTRRIYRKLVFAPGLKAPARNCEKRTRIESASSSRLRTHTIRALGSPIKIRQFIHNVCCKYVAIII